PYRGRAGPRRRARHHRSALPPPQAAGGGRLAQARRPGQLPRATGAGRAAAGGPRRHGRMTTARARPPTDAGPADTRDGGAVARRPHRIGLLAATALLAGVVGWLAGPQPARLGAATTGDPALAAAVRAAVDDPTGYRGLAVALVEDGT